LGATPLEELYVLYRRLSQRFHADGLTVHRAYVGEYATSLEMAGASITVMRLDARLTELLDAPAASPFIGPKL
jgi:dihydroxyacetone kinase